MAGENKDNKSFENNFKKLEALSQELQDNKVPIDALVPRMKEALEAVKICKDVLKNTKVQLNQLSAEFAELGSEESAED